MVVYDPAANGYEVVFFDDFDGPRLDPLWETHTPWMAEPVSENIRICQSCLSLRSYSTNAAYRPGVTTRGPYVGASPPHYTDPLTWQEGFFEARICYTDDGWNHSGFWLYSMAYAQTWPQSKPCPTLCAEIDIMETLVPVGFPNGFDQRNFHTVHRNTPANGSENCSTPDTSVVAYTLRGSGPRLDAWHVWACRWTASTLFFYLDGEQVASHPTYDSTAQPMGLLFTSGYEVDDKTWLYPGGMPPQPPRLEMRVDWVRVWQIP